MKGDVFGSWLKELCSLIFVQTFQAFLLAVVMSIIIAALASSETGTIDACGLLAVFALASFSKIELLLKNIFGLTSSYGDPSLARGKQSFIGGMASIWGARRLLDNPRKVLGGGARALKGRVRMAKAKHDYLEAAGKNLKPGANGNNVANGLAGTAMAAATIGAASSGGGKISELSRNIENLTAAVNSNTAANNANSRDDKLDKLKQAIADAKKERNEGLKSMVMGAAETVGAAHGAVVGGVLGLAGGEDLQELANSIVRGAGAGDIVGSVATNVTVNAVPDIASTVKEAVKEGNRAITNKEAYSRIEKELKKDEDKKFDELNKKLSMYKNNTEKDKGSSVDDV